jgi:hypothetical protein
MKFQNSTQKKHWIFTEKELKNKREESNKKAILQIEEILNKNKIEIKNNLFLNANEEEYIVQNNIKKLIKMVTLLNYSNHVQNTSIILFKR